MGEGRGCPHQGLEKRGFFADCLHQAPHRLHSSPIVSTRCVSSRVREPHRAAAAAASVPAWPPPMTTTSKCGVRDAALSPLNRLNGRCCLVREAATQRPQPRKENMAGERQILTVNLTQARRKNSGYDGKISGRSHLALTSWRSTSPSSVAANWRFGATSLVKLPLERALVGRGRVLVSWFVQVV